MKTRLLFLGFTLAILMIFSCKNEPLAVNQALYSDQEFEVINKYLNLPEESMDYTLHFPSYYRTSSTATNDEVATLGRVIFYDKNLSSDRSISCASCHKQELAFSDDVAFSDGVQSRKTDRNSLALGAVFSFSEYYGSESLGRIPFMWDNRASSVGEQSEMSFRNEREMGMKMDEVVVRMLEQPYYAPLIKKAYGFGEVTEGRVLEALDAFVNSMGSNNSKFDKAMEKASSGFGSIFSTVEENFADFSPQENLGKRLFLNNCSSCHGSIISPAALTSENNGLEIAYADKGIGRLDLKGQEWDGKFKIPTVRNIALTAPYMHDGRFATLDDVLDHYSNGIVDHPNLGQSLKQGNTPRRFNFSQEERSALLAFFNTLTDESYIKDEKFSNPFK